MDVPDSVVPESSDDGMFIVQHARTVASSLNVQTKSLPRKVVAGTRIALVARRKTTMPKKGRTGRSQRMCILPYLWRCGTLTTATQKGAVARNSLATVSSPACVLGSVSEGSS